MKKNIYQPIKAVIEEVIEETHAIKTFRLWPEAEFNFATGQFIELTVPGVGEAPFTPSSDPGVKERLELTIMNVGEVTSKLHTLQKGDVVGIRGPYGQGYPLDKF
ncbi:MAG: FAD-binding oxidoreductase, partial [Candidatus Omnitrophica bacterium]|nr:FAD-binding oxidoreductase [Candidatus Omnitrophota bacterium]